MGAAAAAAPRQNSEQVTKLRYCTCGITTIGAADDVADVALGNEAGSSEGAGGSEGGGGSG